MVSYQTSHHVARRVLRKAPARSGFTLLELMVVIVIIGMLAGVVSFSVRGYLISSKQNVARMEIAKITQAMETFYLAHDRYPTPEEGVGVLARKTNKFPDGILNEVPKDPWNRAYAYLKPGRGKPFEVISLGADGREGGEGADMDISASSDNAGL